jgi:hypothetical protein
MTVVMTCARAQGTTRQEAKGMAAIRHDDADHGRARGRGSPPWTTHAASVGINLVASWIGTAALKSAAMIIPRLARHILIEVCSWPEPAEPQGQIVSRDQALGIVI